MTETRAEWCEEIEVNSQTLPERVRVRSSSNWIGVAYSGDWIVHKQDDTFITVRAEEFISEGYVQV